MKRLGFPLHWYQTALAVNYAFEAAGVPVRMTFPPPSQAEVAEDLGAASAAPAFRPLRRSNPPVHAVEYR